MSRVVAAVCSLATLAPSPAVGLRRACLFGTLILITSYAKAASGIAKFQSWQLIVRYGGHGVAHGDPEDFKTATGFAFALDVVSGIARDAPRGGASALHRQLGRDQPRTICGWRCSIARCFQPWARRRPTACFASLDRFDLISWSGTVTPIARAILAAVAFAPERAVPGLCRHLVRHRPRRRSLYLVPRLARDAAPRLAEGHSPTLRPTSLPGAWKFAINVNLAASVQAVWGPVARLVVGGLLGPGGRGLVPRRLEPRRQRAEARRPARHGLLSRNRADGPHDRKSRGS